MWLKGGLRRDYIMPVVVVICIINPLTFASFLPLYFWESNKLIFFFNWGGQQSLTFRMPPILGFWNPLRSCQQTQIAVQLKTVTLKRWERTLRICYRTRKLVLSSLGKEKSRKGRNCKGCSWEKTMAMTKTGARRTGETKRDCVSSCNHQNYAWEGMQGFMSGCKVCWSASQESMDSLQGECVNMLIWGFSLSGGSSFSWALSSWKCMWSVFFTSYLLFILIYKLTLVFL